MKNYIVGKFNISGGNEVDVELICKNWNHLWSIQSWHGEYKLYKQLRKNTSSITLKTSISKEQANELITKLNLVELKSSIFRNASTFKKKEHFG